MPEIRWAILSVWLGLLVSGNLFAEAPFAAPVEGMAPFRRDRLPLEPGRMTDLARELGEAGKRLPLGTAPQRRTVAQVFALAMALDPDNDALRVRLKALEQGTFAPAETSGAEDFGRLWELARWLEGVEERKDARALAACLSDVLAAIDPAAASKEGAERGKWEGWVAPVDHFEVLETIDDEKVVENKGESEEEAPALAFGLTSAEVSTPLWIRRDGKPEEVALVKLRVDASPGIASKPSVMEAAGDVMPLAQFDAALAAVLEQAGASKGGRFRISWEGELSLFTGQGDRREIAAALAVLIHATVSGKEPAAIVIGALDGDGGFIPASRGWERLRALAEGPGGRLVIAPGAARLLPAFLALEQPEFFFKYEVLAAANADELFDRASREPSPEIAAAGAKFREVRSKLGTQAADHYVANRFVRQRLVDLAVAAPDHLSARMLAIQSSGERPTTFPRDVLASELRRAIEPMAWLARESVFDLDSRKIDETYNACRPAVDRLARFASREDRELYNRVLSLVTDVRSFSRGFRSRDVAAGYITPEAVSQHAMLARLYATVDAELKALLDPPP